MICGDKPVIEYCMNGTFLVHPSPWNGKEKLSGSDTAPLAAIIMLSRGEETTITEPPVQNYAAKLFGAILNLSDSEMSIQRAASFEEKLIKSTRVFSMVNGGVPNSSKLLYDTVLKELD